MNIHRNTSTVLYLQRKQAIVICRTTNIIKFSKFHAVSLICLVVFFFFGLSKTHTYYLPSLPSQLYLLPETRHMFTRFSNITRKVHHTRTRHVFIKYLCKSFTSFSFRWQFPWLSTFSIVRDLEGERNKNNYLKWGKRHQWHNQRGGPWFRTLSWNPVKGFLKLY